MMLRCFGLTLRISSLSGSVECEIAEPKVHRVTVKVINSSRWKFTIGNCPSDLIASNDLVVDHHGDVLALSNRRTNFISASHLTSEWIINR